MTGLMDAAAIADVVRADLPPECRVVAEMVQPLHVRVTSYGCEVPQAVKMEVNRRRDDELWVTYRALPADRHSV